MVCLRLSLLVLVATGAFATSALARPKVAILKIVGPNGDGARRVLERGLGSRYTVLDEMAVPNACQELGVQMTKGPNLAACAGHVGAQAVVGGAARGRNLTLVVFAGKTGQVLVQRRMRWSRSPSRAMVRTLLRTALGAVRRAPRLGPKASPSVPTDPVDVPDEPAAPLTFNPSQVNQQAPTGKPRTPTGTEPDENPLARREHATAPASAPVVKAAAREPRFPRRPRLVGSGGFGLWMRSFAINQPAEERWSSSYSSGATFTIKLGAEAFPLAFLWDNFAQDFLLRFSFQTAIGLASGIAGKSVTSLSTAMSEWGLQLGYRWNILNRALGPELEGTFGVGSTQFSIDWGQETRSLPDAGYTFVELGTAGTYHVWDWLGAYLRFAYRIVTGSSGVVDEDAPGYGPSSVGGIVIGLGVDGRYKDFVARLEYCYTRYFYSFSDVVARRDSGKPSAGGALDQFHGFFLNIGYSY